MDYLEGENGAPDRIPRVAVCLGHSGAPDVERPAIVIGAIPVNALGNDVQTLATILSVSGGHNVSKV